MICARHNWWAPEPCAVCADQKPQQFSEGSRATPPGEKTKRASDVTATETVSPDASPPDRKEELPDLPDFLKRNADGSFAHPELLGEPNTVRVDIQTTTGWVEPIRPVDAANAEIKRIKTTNRIEKLKAAQEGREPVLIDLDKALDGLIAGL